MDSTYVNVQAPTTRSISPIRVYRMFLRLIRIRRYARMSCKLILQRFVGMRSKIINANMSRRSRRVFPLRKMNRAVNISELRLQVASLVLGTQSVMSIPARLAREESNNNDSRTRQIVPQ